MPKPTLAPLEANNGKVAGWEQSWVGRVIVGEAQKPVLLSWLLPACSL